MTEILRLSGVCKAFGDRRGVRSTLYNVPDGDGQVGPEQVHLSPYATIDLRRGRPGPIADNGKSKSTGVALRPGHPSQARQT